MFVSGGQAQVIKEKRHQVCQSKSKNELDHFFLFTEMPDQGDGEEGCGQDGVPKYFSYDFHVDLFSVLACNANGYFQNYIPTAVVDHHAIHLAHIH